MSDVDIEYGDDNEIEIEIENHNPERSLIREQGEQWMQELEPSQIRSLLGR